jgi:hypothetical protein
MGAPTLRWLLCLTHCHHSVLESPIGKLSCANITITVLAKPCQLSCSSRIGLCCLPLASRIPGGPKQIMGVTKPNSTFSRVDGGNSKINPTKTSKYMGACLRKTSLHRVRSSRLASVGHIPGLFACAQRLVLPDRQCLLCHDVPPP